MSFELVGVRLVAQDAPQFNSAMASADKAVTGFGDTSSQTFKQMPGLADIATGALHRVGAMAIEVFAQAGQAAVGFLKDSISVAGDFESGMNRFAAVAGGALEESGLALKDFRDQFIQIGKELPVSTSEVQDAAIEMVKGGIEPATIAAGGLKQVIQFAAAADLDLAEASTIAAKALGGWVAQTASAQEKADFLTHSTDLLSRAANASTVDVDDLALGLYNVQGTAKLAGVSFDETVTALAQLAPSFSSSADAGTSFKAFLSRLQPTTKPATEAMIALGLATDDGVSKFYDAQGAFIGMEAASKLLRDTTKDLTEAQRVNLLQTIFGQDAIRVAAVLSEQGADGYNAMTAALEKQNSVADMAKQKQAGFNTAMDNFKGSVEALQITIGSLLLPMLTDLFNNYLAPGINVLTDLSGAVFGDVDALARLSPELQNVVATAQMLWSEVQAGIGYVQGLIASFQSTSAESSALGGAIDQLTGIWNTLIQTITDVAKGYEMVMNAVLPIVSDLIGEHGDEVMSFFQDTFDTVVDIVEIALKLYDGIVTGTLIVVADFIKEHGETIKAIITNVWTIIKNVIGGALDIIKGLLTAALKIFQGDWEGAWTAIREMSESVVKRLWEIIKAGLDLIANLFGTTLQGIADTWVHNWETFKGLVIRGIDAFVGFFTGLPEQLSNVGSAIVDSIWNGLKDRWDAFVSDLEQKLQDLKDMLPFSEPKDPSSPLRGLQKSGYSMVEEIQIGIDSFGPLILPTVQTRSGGSLDDLLGGSGVWGRSGDDTDWGSGGGGGGGGAGTPDWWPSARVSGIASASLIGLRGGASSITNNQQRTASITYNTAVAPPMSQSYAMAQALVGGF